MGNIFASTDDGDRGPASSDGSRSPAEVPPPPPPPVLEIVRRLDRLIRVSRLEQKRTSLKLRHALMQSRTHTSIPLFASLVKHTEQYTGVPVPTPDASTTRVPTLFDERVAEKLRRIYYGLLGELYAARSGALRQDTVLLTETVRRMKSTMGSLDRIIFRGIPSSPPVPPGRAVNGGTVPPENDTPLDG